ncbi:MAG: hypothetical protein K0S55_988 [Clostridia bacterium]|nr:hypothetical protein [Clostridia bacterium]
MKKFIVVCTYIIYIILMDISLIAAPVLPDGSIDDPGENGVVFKDVTVGEHTLYKNIKGSLYYFSITVSKSNENNDNKVWEYISRWTATFPVETIWIKGRGGDTDSYIDYTINKNNYYGENDIEYTATYETPINEIDIKNVIFWFTENNIDEEIIPKIFEEKIPPQTSDSMSMNKTNLFLLFAFSSLLVIIYIKILIKKL